MGGIHLITLNNVVDVTDLGHLGTAQLDFVQKDVANLRSEALRLGDRALNGHIHQILSKVERNVTFSTTTTTAYPLPAPAPHRRRRR